jgi:hypothetical protein
MLPSGVVDSITSTQLFYGQLGYALQGLALLLFSEAHWMLGMNYYKLATEYTRKLQGE